MYPGDQGYRDRQQGQQDFQESFHGKGRVDGWRLLGDFWILKPLGAVTQSSVRQGADAVNLETDQEQRGVDR